MSLLRIILTAIIAFFAMVAGLVIAMGVMLFGGLARLLGGKPIVRASVNMNRAPRAAARPAAQSPHRHDPSVIDVEATTLPQEPRRELET